MGYRGLVAGLALWCSGCATCTPYQNIGVESRPPGAEIFLDGEAAGLTPTRLAVPTASDHTVYLKLDGHEPHMVVLHSNQPGDGLNFLTPPDIYVRLMPLLNTDRDLEIEVEPESDPLP